ncbi:MAG: Lipoate-protein ligase A [Lentisphaerae bacterium ADurb.BinA184]|nr:MAG: Lipoate-protein ligase A [Lentisphaerae bacterium ADurb.BinA184]
MPTPPATASGTPAVAWPGLARQVFISRETDPWFNLALEEWLVRRHPAATVAVFVYRNRPCVVIGRNQNPWLECRIGEMRRRGVGLARRISGGGAVYHDLGNLNYTVVVPRPHYTREAPFGPVLDALRGFGLAPALDGRHAIRIEGRKVSGSAFLVTSAAALHHGSLLVSTDLAALDAVLNPDAAAFETHAVRSRPDVVANLAEWAPGLTSARVTDALLDAFGCAGTPPVELSADACRRQPGFLAVEERHRSRGWLLGHTPAFHRTVTVGAGGCEVRIGVTVREGVVESAAPCPADAVSPAAGRDIWQSWIGQPYDQVCDAGPLPLPPPHPQP